MAKIDILCLRRRELLQMLNNCGFGNVLTIQQLRYYCDNNDIRGTNDQGVSLLKYAAMLTCEYFQPAAKPFWGCSRFPKCRGVISSGE